MSEKSTCPTCGEKRFVPVEFGECVRCRETSNLLSGKERSPSKSDGECGYMRVRPFDTEKSDPFTI